MMLIYGYLFIINIIFKVKDIYFDDNFCFVRIMKCWFYIYVSYFLI